MLSKPHQRAQQAIAQVVETGQAWISGIRWRVAAWVLGIALATTATLMFTGIAVVPILGVAAAAAVMSVNRVASRLNKPVCLSCGEDLSGRAVSEHGTPCPACGALHQPAPASVTPEQIAQLDDDDAQA